MPRAAAVNARESRRSSRSSGEAAMLRELFEGSTDAVQLDDVDGRVIFANGAWLSLFQVEVDDAEGAKWTRLVKGRLLKGQELGRSWSRCKKGGSVQGIVALKSDGDGPQQVSYTRMPVRTKSGEVWAVLSIFRIQGTEPGGQDIADAVHDLKNIFTSIIIGSQLIERQNSDIPDLTSKVGLIQRAASRGLELLDKLGGKSVPGVAGDGSGKGS